MLTRHRKSDRCRRINKAVDRHAAVRVDDLLVLPRITRHRRRDARAIAKTSC
jgi:hypothetical protein